MSADRPSRLGSSTPPMSAKSLANSSPYRLRLVAGLISSTSALTLLGCGQGTPTVPTIATSEFAAIVLDDADGNGSRSDGDRALGDVDLLFHDNYETLAERVTTGDDGVAVVAPTVTAPAQVTIESSHVTAPAAGSDIAVPITRSAVGLPGIVATVATTISPCDQVGTCDELLLPDLVPIIELPEWFTIDEEARTDYPDPSAWYIDRETVPGRRLLRISSITANLGDGPLVVTRGAVATDLASATVFQRLFTETGAWRDIESGSFIHHDEHDHVHLEAFESLTLTDLAGRPVATTHKLSFCLTDVVRISETPTPAPVRVDLEAWACSATEQGINPGWADYYGPALADQWIDITDVLAGDYLVEFVADPDDVLTESDETNNTITMPLTLTESDVAD